MNNAVDEKHLISPFLIVPLMYVSMVGVGVLNFQRELAEHAGYNAYISVVIVGISIHLIVWMIYKILRSNPEGLDITAINHTYFGKIAGSIINFAIVLYFFFGAYIEFKAYIEVIQVWMFPSMKILPISTILMLLIYYTVSGGFRSVTGLSFLGFLMSLIFIIPENLPVLPYLHPQNLMPLFNHSASDILLSSKSMIYQFLGFEALLLFYPFIKSPAKSQKWAHLMVIFVTLLYLMIIIITFMYFSEGQLRQISWPTLNMLKIIEGPVFQRVEYLAISLWLLKNLSGISLSLWAACRGMKNVFRIKPRASLLAFLVGILILDYFLKDRSIYRWISEFYSDVGLYFIYGYIPIMFVVTQIRKMGRRIAIE
ncbi:GerAB/ArcD/ProY family transporter [Paenibacillus sacheonensis]|uniref:GerAB/ArcD/ProY family transporter n=1 Tax=Paenibacillus sacheonensis TaxID=742054 RepID=A0A7X4YJR8_9BACL|nr:GerAB/ArcD/ProY family transporter [Paenibacillus sacheonensis]MBM7563984.1 spore germination protein (amino acid permease) [Paenibacillus sacheonensis]NBC67676.1 GerAB/ArcD/ProY family transporter [Paenibacillus sacheonensis]